MAYANTGLRLLVGGLSNGACRLWCYDTTDALSTVVGAGYISDAAAVGMRAGDMVIFRRFSDLTDLSTIIRTSLLRVDSVSTSGTLIDELSAVEDVAVTISIALAASATTDGMDITITVTDEDGVAIDAVHALEVWISESAIGAGLTADTYSGDVTVVTGTELQEVVSKKHFNVLTDANGVCGMLAVASANPTDQYIAVKHPVSGKVIVSAASGTNWECV